MSWQDKAETVARAVADHAPLLGSALLGPAGATAGSLIASVFGTGNDPDQIAAAIAQDPQAGIKLRQIEADHRKEITRLYFEAETARIQEVNATMRAELETDDKYRGRWRPTFGYVMAASFGLQVTANVAAIGAAAFVHPEHAGTILNAVADLANAQTAIWSVGLGVLGVQAYRRSGDKRAAMGHPQPGLLDRIQTTLPRRTKEPAS